MAMFKEASFLLEIITETLADKIQKHFTESHVHYDPNSDKEDI